MSLILAIDQSTSATKAVLFDHRGKVLDRAARSHRQIYPRPGWVEHDPEQIWRNVRAVVREVATRNRSKLSHLTGLSITNQRETVIVFERKSGKPLHNAIVWQDRRGVPVCSRLVQQGQEARVRRKTGLRLDCYFSAPKLKWLVNSRPTIARHLHRGEAVIGTVDAFLIHRLTGGAVFATDYTNASRTLLFDVRKLRWDPWLCLLFQVPVSALPEARESTARYGETDVAGILPGRVPIVGVMGDSQASLFAQRCYRPGTAKATFGTGTSLLLNIGDKLRIPGDGTVTALAWTWRGKPTYALEGLINYSAATIEWLKEQLGLLRSADEAERLATSVENNGGVYFVPAFAGLGAPYWNPEARAAIVGMTPFTHRGHIVRAAQEAIAYQIRDVLDMMRAKSGVRLRTLYGDGGPTRNRFLMQFTADATRTTLVVSEVAESSAWGAAMNGFLGLGIYHSLQELVALPRAVKTFRPRTKSSIMDRWHKSWLSAVRRVL
jgi:glycerol kinase